MKKFRTSKLLMILVALISGFSLVIPAVMPQIVNEINVSISCTAGEALSRGDIAAIKSADGLCYKADADASTLRPAVGMVIASVASKGGAKLARDGIVSGLSSLTRGAPVYLSTTAGATTQSEPAAYSQVVGFAVSATEFTLSIGMPTAINDSQITTAKINDAAVTADKLAAAVAGAGLIGGAGSALALSPDDATIELSGDSLRLKDLGVVTGKINTGAVTSVKASTPLKTRSLVVSFPDAGASGSDLTNYVLWSPSVAITITKVYHLVASAWTADVSPNDAEVKITNAAVGVVATLAVTTALAQGSINNMGTITNPDVVANTNVTLDVTANGTADAPAGSIQIEYLTAD